MTPKRTGMCLGWWNRALGTGIGPRLGRRSSLSLPGHCVQNGGKEPSRGAKVTCGSVIVVEWARLVVMQLKWGGNLGSII